MTEETENEDPLFSRICETSARLMGGTVGRSTLKELKKRVGTAGEYPWQAVVERVLADPVDQQALTQKVLRAQRDWVVRGGRQTPSPRLRQKSKSFVARLLAALVFAVIFTLAAVIVLVLMKHKWPDMDIYRILEWLRTVLPSVFAR